MSDINKKTKQTRPKGDLEPTVILLPAKGWGRFWTTIIDSSCVSIVVGVLYLLSLFILGPQVSNFMKTGGEIKFMVFDLILSLGYTMYFNVNRGATIGKDVYGFKVVGYHSSNNINYLQALVRELFKTGITIIPAVGELFYIINIFIVNFSKENRGFHDFAGKTQVVKIKEPWSIKNRVLLIVGLSLVSMGMTLWLGKITQL